MSKPKKEEKTPTEGKSAKSNRTITVGTAELQSIIDHLIHLSNKPRLEAEELVNRLKKSIEN